MVNVNGCRLIDIPTFTDDRGSLSTIEGLTQICPFVVRRIFWTYNTEGEITRGNHAHYSTYELMVVLHGCVDVILDDGIKQEKITMFEPSKGLYIAPQIWRKLYNYQVNTICIFLCSAKEFQGDRIHNYEQFLKVIRNES